MDVIGSEVDRQGAAYRQNFEAMQRRVEELRRELSRVRSERSEKARRRSAELGKLTVQERLDRLLDPGTPWLEIAPLAARGMYEGDVHGAGSRAGIGVIQGREVVVHANDPTIKGGTVYPMGVKKTLRVQAIAMENRLPVVMLVDSGGAYLPLQSEIFPDADDGGRIFYNQAQMSKANIPQITAVMGLCTAGGAYIPAMSDHVVHVRGTGAIFLGGPPLVRAATGEEVSAEELGGALVHCQESGVSDYLAEDDADALRIVRDLVETIPPEPAPGPDRAPEPPAFDPAEIYGIVPASLSTPYDVREVLARLVDGSRFLEFKALYGPTLVCGFAFVHGYRVGILANNGVLFSPSALKATQFVQLCDRQGIPLLFLQNVAGYIIGREYERGGITKDGHKMVNAVATATVPKLTVIVGQSYGAGNYGMCGRAYSPRFLWTWPNARIGVMGGEQAAQVLVSVKNDQLEREGKPRLTREEEEQMRAPILALAEEEGSAWHSTANLWDDGILDPARTREALGLALAVARRPQPEGRRQGYGTFRM
jgi:acetyl-CoA carboxylase carboxyltransferase component